jgi:hypothetical protein
MIGIRIEIRIAESEGLRNKFGLGWSAEPDGPSGYSPALFSRVNSSFCHS